MLSFGVDALLTTPPEALLKKRLALVTNDAATASQKSYHLIPTRRALLEAGFDLALLLSPEHGMDASAPDGQAVPDAQDGLTELPIHSLYNESEQIDSTVFDDIDAVLFDVPDVGIRFYTYIWTLSRLLEACAFANVPLYVLDRPNPLGGDLDRAEGPMLDEVAASSFVGRWNIPVRHSLTVGELARLWNDERQIGADLRVIEVSGWDREAMWPGWRFPYVPPSPAMPSFETNMLYGGTCFLEGTNVSEGRGTAFPFRVAGAPWVDGRRLCDAMNDLPLSGVRCRPAAFWPAKGKYAETLCEGIMLHVTDYEAARPVEAGLVLVTLLHAFHRDAFEWAPYRTAANPTGESHFDLLTGGTEMRRRISEDPSDLLADVSSCCSAPGWKDRAKPHLLY